VQAAYRGQLIQVYFSIFCSNLTATPIFDMVQAAQLWTVIPDFGSVKAVTSLKINKVSFDERCSPLDSCPIFTLAYKLLTFGELSQVQFRETAQLFLAAHVSFDVSCSPLGSCHRHTFVKAAHLWTAAPDLV
jgi:hypothetical protein